MADARIEVAPLDRSHLPRIVELHARAFPSGAITALGVEATRRYYAWLLEGPHDAAITGAFLGDALVGFCAAGVFRGAMSGFLRANRRYLALRIATRPWLLLDRTILERVLTAGSITVRFSRRRAASAAAPSPSAPRSFGVLAIGTDPSVRGVGAGRALMLDAEARARVGGFARMVLTVAPDNHRAVRFYEQLGWTRVDDGGRWSGTMQRALGAP